MTNTGLVSIGNAYREKIDRLCEIVGASSDGEAIRIVTDMIVEDADMQHIRTIPRKHIGIKSKAGAIMKGSQT